MSTVHGKTTATTNARTTVRSRRKKPAEITCSGCGGSIENFFGCSCLNETRLYRKTAEYLPAMVRSIRDVSPAQAIVWMTTRRSVRQALEMIVAQEEQRAREKAAYRAFVRDLYDNPHPRFAASRDREILDHLLGTYRCTTSIRSLDEVAEAWHRPVAYVRDLRDRCLEAMRRWPVEDKDTAGERRAA